jgi:hypothetical protein
LLLLLLPLLSLKMLAYRSPLLLLLLLFLASLCVQSEM